MYVTASFGLEIEDGANLEDEKVYKAATESVRAMIEEGEEAELEEDPPVVELSLEEPTIKVVRNEREHTCVWVMPPNTKLRYPGVKETSSRAYFFGPGVVTKVQGVNGTQWHEEYINHDVEGKEEKRGESTWDWVQRLMQKGMDAYKAEE